MAIGWLTVLKMVPWGDVIENAPKVAVGAKKLWDKVGKKPEVVVPETVGPVAPSPAQAQAQMQQQLAALQRATAELHQQMLDSTELIKTLAEQNTQLVKRVESNRKRVLWLALLVLGLVITVIVKLF